jgi:hypothetical protein
MLHWFGNDKKLCVQEIFHQFKNGIIAPLFGDSLWSHPFHAKTKTIAIDAYFIFYKRHYWHKSIVYERQNTQKEFCWESIIAISLYFNLTSPKQQYSNNT